MKRYSDIQLNSDYNDEIARQIEQQKQMARELGEPLEEIIGVS